MRTRKATFVEIVSDPELKAREADVTKAVNELYPGSGPVKLYRTADGQVGFELRVAITAGDKKRLDQLYSVVMKVLGRKRGRPPGVKTVQTKVRLPEPVFADLKKAADESHQSMSHVVAECLVARLRAPKRTARRTSLPTNVNP
jgi:hypothetical protein